MEVILDYTTYMLFYTNNSHRRLWYTLHTAFTNNGIVSPRFFTLIGFLLTVFRQFSLLFCTTGYAGKHYQLKSVF